MVIIAVSECFTYIQSLHTPARCVLTLKKTALTLPVSAYGCWYWKSSYPCTGNCAFLMVQAALCNTFSGIWSGLFGHEFLTSQCSQEARRSCTKRLIQISKSLAAWNDSMTSFISEASVLTKAPRIRSTIYSALQNTCTFCYFFRLDLLFF